MSASTGPVPDVALRAVARVDGACPWLSGEGAETGNLHRLAGDLGIADRVRFTGWLDEPIHAIAAGEKDRCGRGGRGQVLERLFTQ